MTLFQMNWLRRWVRRHTHPIPEVKAALWKRRLSLLYGLFAWQTFGFVCYMIYTGRNDWAYYYGYKTEEEKNESQALQFSRTLGKDSKGKIIRFSGFKKIEEIDFDNTEKDTK